MNNIKLPSKFLNRMKNLLGEEYEDFINAFNNKVPVSIRKNPFKNAPRFEGEEEIGWCTTARFLKERPAFVFDPSFHCGSYYVQESSSIVLDYLIRYSVDLENEICALDLCASPGGKSTLVASLLNSNSLLISNELVGNRAHVLKENLIRWGLPNTIVSNNHSRDFKPFKGLFDLILLDAPCSGEGMFRKHQLSIDQWSNNKIESLAAIQKDLLDEMAPLIKEKGIIIYSTCTHALEEDEGNVKQFLEEHPDFELVPIDLPKEWGFSNQIALQHYPDLPSMYRAFFHKAKGEGFFFSVLRKKEGEIPGNYRKAKKSIAKLKDIDKRLHAQCASFIKHSDAYLFKSEDLDIYAIPKSILNTQEILSSHLRLIKPGTLVGSIKGKSFIPSIDLALSTIVHPNTPVIEISKDDALKYYKGMNLEIQFEGEQGWYMVRYNGNNLGWVKVLKNRINNHLPKSWKIRKSIDSALGE